MSFSPYFRMLPVREPTVTPLAYVIASSRLNKITFSTDTLETTANYVSADTGNRCNSNTYNNNLHGFFAEPNFAGSTKRINFADGTAATAGSAITLTVGADCNTPSTGYTLGGDNGGATSSGLRFTFSTRTGEGFANSLKTARAYSIGTTDTTIAGYAHGGIVGVAADTIDKMVFSTETASTLTSKLSEVKFFSGGYNSSTAGYCLGGKPTASTLSSKIEKLVYSTATNSNLSVALTSARQTPAGTNSSAKGYACGGNTSASVSSPITQIQALTFSDDTVATLGITLSALTLQGAPAAVQSGTP